MNEGQNPIVSNTPQSGDSFSNTGEGEGSSASGKIIRPKRNPLKAWFLLCPVRHIILIVSLVIIGLFFLLRNSRKLMVFLSDYAIRPLHDRITVLAAKTEYSVAEILIVAAVVFVVFYLIFWLIRMIRKSGRIKRLYRMIITLATLVCFVYAGFCALWGVYYYGDDFISRSGLSEAEISVEELTSVTEYFAGLANEYSFTVNRDDAGYYQPDRSEILQRSDEVFLNIEQQFSCLKGPEVRAKGIYFSALLSYLDFTGFYFPLTSEANVNTDFPGGLFAATVAHELSHLRGVAKEQEANFVAVLACLNYGDADYCYSASLMAYTYLGNALYSADWDAWEIIYNGLNDNVRADLEDGNKYWEKFETPVRNVSNAVYEEFLQSYDQKLGRKSYGACVDLLVNYYYAPASEAIFN